MRRAALLSLLVVPGLVACSEPDPVHKSPGPPASPDRQQDAPASQDDGPEYVSKGPSALEPAEVGIGREVANVAFVDVGGRRGDLAGVQKRSPALVVIFTSLGCPVTKAYAPLLKDVVARLQERKVAVLVVDPAIQDDAADIRAQAERLGWTFTVTQDPGYALSDALGARRTADVFLLDGSRRLQYRGPLDDQFGINYRLEKPRRRYLEEALDALLAGGRVESPAFEAPGCLLSRVELPD